MCCLASASLKKVPAPVSLCPKLPQSSAVSQRPVAPRTRPIPSFKSPATSGKVRVPAAAICAAIQVAISLPRERCRCIDIRGGT